MTTRSILQFGLGSVFGLLALAALASCAGNSTNASIQIITSDAQILANGLQSELTQLSALNIKGLSPDVMAKMGVAIADTQKVAGALGKVNSLDSAQPLIKNLEDDVNILVATAAVLPLPPQVQLGFQAAAILLPFIEQTAGMVVSQIAANNAVAAQPAVAAVPVAAVLPTAALGSRPTVYDQARAILSDVRR